MRTVHQAPVVVTAPVELDRAPSAAPAMALEATLDLEFLATAIGTGRSPPGGFAATLPQARSLGTLLRL